jgi:1-acyl-sn-glycerol-3-phosphate acyltransferase
VNSTKTEYAPKIVISACRLIGLSVSKVLWRIEFQGLENIPKDLKSGLIVAPNHQTYCDPVWVCLKLNRRFRFMAWDEIFNWFFVGKLIKYLGAFPVGLNRKGFVKASRKALQVLREGATLILFPEGEREFSDGKLLKFKSGAVRLAMEAEVPILPVTIRGANKIWAQDMKFPHLGKVQIIYHPIFKVPKPEKDQEIHSYIEDFNQKLTEIISSKL